MAYAYRQLPIFFNRRKSRHTIPDIWKKSRSGKEKTGKKKTEKAEDAENPSEYEILKGVVNGVYKDMILISYSYRENVQTTKKGLFSEKVIEEEKTVEAHSLINRKCIVRVDILDLSLDGEEEEYDEGEDSE